MTHRRKDYIVYPPGYVPGKHRYYKRRSRLQATKLAVRLGAGSGIMVVAHIHPARGKSWTSSVPVREYEIAARL